MTLIVHRDSRTEVLAQRLVAALAGTRPRNPLAAHTIVVAHPGLKRWLLAEFAQQRGIAANFDMLLPWQWLQRCARVLLGDEALIDGAYRAESLRWRIHALLPALAVAPVRAYLHGEDGERRRFQLADHLADLYTQYLIYRPDWIARWEQGADGDEWQAQLWRRLRESIAAPHRAQRRAALLAALAQRGDGETQPLHVFGVSHLAPDVLDALHALAAHRDVHVYFPDPCRQYWADLKRPRELLALQPNGGPSSPSMASEALGLLPGEDLYYEIGHPLLVSLGRMAQDFFIRLDELGVELGGEEDREAPPQHLLQAVQSSIRDCDVAILAGDSARAADASLRVHACHTRLRELEVLKDSLLGFLADDAELQHRDIVVMAPDIAAYAPYLRAVFGEPARYEADRTRIPWHLADVGLTSAHPLLAAFTRVLDLAQSRFTISEVMDFLDVAAAARRFGIDADARVAIERRLRSAHVAWGLDAAMKENAGGAAVDQNSWAFGFDRLYAGLVAGDDRGDELLDGILPVAGMGGGEGEAIGRLQVLIDVLRRVRDGFSVARSLGAWRDWLIAQLDVLFDVRDEAESAAFAALRRALARLGEQAEAAGHDALPWSVMREAVRAELGKVSERQAFLLGGVTFCGLVPQRSIPFKVVCLLGMNEGEFPRQGGDAGLNLMLREPRRGDRDTRREDRQLFLEALMAARERLHISFVGEGVRDGKRRNPAAPVAELLQFLDERHDITDKDTARPWLIRHPLQPFDARYFDNSDERVFTFDPTYEALPPRVAAMPFVDALASRDFAPACELQLAWLKRYWRDPARAQLRDEAQLSLDALDADTWPDREPLDAMLDRRDGVERKLLRAALANGASELPAQVPDWLARSGAIASGAAGERAYAQARERAQAVLAQAREFLDDVEPFVQLVELDLGYGIRLSGSVDAFRRSDGCVCVFGAKPSGRAKIGDMLQFYIDFAAAKLAGDATGLFVQCEKTKGKPASAGPPKLLDAILLQERDQLRAGLRRLVDLTSNPDLLFPPYTASAWLYATPQSREDVARTSWEGAFLPGERSYTPGYAALIARDRDFLDVASPAHVQFLAAVQAIASVLDPQRRVLLSDGTAKPRRRVKA
jgi:exodeoxyribonuclease V gamma subunit